MMIQMRVRIRVQNPMYPHETLLDRTYDPVSAQVVLADMGLHGLALHGRVYRACIDADAVDDLRFGQVGVLTVTSATGLRLAPTTRAKLRGDGCIDFAIYMDETT